MNRPFLTIAIAAALSVPALSTMAAASADASFGRVSITLIDLDLTDGTSPALTYRYEQSSSSAGNYGTLYDSDFAGGFYLPTTAAVADAWGRVSSSTGAGGLQASAMTSMAPAGGSFATYSGNGQIYAEFEISPRTGLILAADYALASITTVGWAGGGTEWATSLASISLVTLADEGGESYYASRHLQSSYQWDGLQYRGQSANDSGTLSLSYANVSDDVAVGVYVSMAYAFTDSSIPVPEPGRLALMLVGLTAVGAWSHRRAR